MADDSEKRVRKRAPRKKKSAAPPEAAPPEPPRIPGEPSRDDVGRLLAGEHSSPHSFLGAHPLVVDGTSGVTIRALAANAIRVECVLEDGRVMELPRVAEGLSDLYAAFVPGLELPVQYR